MMHLRHDQSGISLVELLIATLVTGFLMTVVISFSVNQLGQSDRENIKYQLLSNAETGLNQITNDIRIASAAYDNNSYQDPYSPGAPSNELSWASNSTTLVLGIAATDKNDHILFSDAHDYDSEKNNVIYYLSGSSIYRRVLADPVTGNTAVTTCPAAHATKICPADGDVLDNVSSFSVQYYNGENQQVDPGDARSVQLSVTLLVRKYNQNITTSYTTRMVFRNG